MSGVYEAAVTIRLIKRYELLIRRDAADEADAAEKIRWEAMGLAEAQIAQMCDQEPQFNHLIGTQVDVSSVGRIEEVPDDGWDSWEEEEES